MCDDMNTPTPNVYVWQLSTRLPSISALVNLGPGRSWPNYLVVKEVFLCIPIDVSSHNFDPYPMLMIEIVRRAVILCFH